MSTAKSSCFTTRSIAQLVEGELVGPGDLKIIGVESMGRADEDQLTFIGDARFAREWTSARCRAALVTRGLEVAASEDRALIFVDQADLAMAKVLTAFAPPRKLPDVGVHPTAVIDSSATLGNNVRIGPLCHVGPGVRVGDDCTLHTGVVLMADACVGNGCELFPSVIMGERCELGERCVLHPHVTIGADGFGYRPDPDRGIPVKMPQIGTVLIGSDVEIGASTCIDRGKFAATVIGDHVKLDNLIQIGHNCHIERGVIIAGLCAIAGSVTIETGAILGGTVRIAEHVTVGRGAQLAGGTQLGRDVPAGEVWGGAPGQLLKATMRRELALRKLPDLVRKLKRG